MSKFFVIRACDIATLSTFDSKEEAEDYAKGRAGRDPDVEFAVCCILSGHIGERGPIKVMSVHVAQDEQKR